MVVAVEKIDQHGKEIRIVKLPGRDPETAHIGIQPGRDEKTGVPEQQAVGKTVADDEIETAAPAAKANIELWRKVGGQHCHAGGPAFANGAHRLQLVGQHGEIAGHTQSAVGVVFRADDNQAVGGGCSVRRIHASRLGLIIGAEIVGQESGGPLGMPAIEDAQRQVLAAAVPREPKYV